MDIRALSSLDKTLLCIYISCVFIIGKIVKEILDRPELSSTLTKKQALKAASFWVYYWLVQDIWQFDALRLPEAETHKAMDQITMVFVRDFPWDSTELIAKLKEAQEAEARGGGIVFLTLSKNFGSQIGSDIALSMTVTALVTAHFEAYHTLLFETIDHDDDTKVAIINDFLTNYYPKMRDQM